MKMSRYFASFFLLYCLGFGAYGQQIITIDSFSKSQIGKNLAFYLPGKEVTFQDVLHAPFSFIPHQKVPNLGIQKNSVWIKFILTNNNWSKTLALDLGNSTIGEAELFFQKEPGGPWEHNLISKKLPLSARKYKGADFIFRLDNASNQPSTYYLRVRSKQPLILPFNINTAGDQLIQTIKKNWLNGIYFGMILIMGLYNLFIFFSVKDRSYLYYVLFIFSAGLTQLTLKGLAFQYFWPEHPFFENHCMIFFASVSGIAALLFTRRFLNIKQLFPVLNRVILFFIFPFVLSIAFICADLVDQAFLIMQLTTALSSLLILFSSIYAIKKGSNIAAIYFIIAWSFLIMGTLIYILKDYNILPYDTFTNYSVQLSSAIEMTLLSFALASRINILKKEKELSRMTALKLAHENERIIKQQNILLEEQVAKRTEELRHKNEVLKQTHEDLKQTQSQLVAAEKMSSLGQLTAGIAHEINNPINFVTANINPLKRDIHQLFDTIARVELISEQHLSPEIKKEEIRAFKEEQDFDYLKTEIGHLLKGIQEGASRTADIVKGLRIFSRLDEDNLKSADINEGLLSTLTISNNLLAGIDLDTQLGDIPPVICYPGKLNQVFLNIITNGAFAIRQQFNDKKGGILCLKTYTDGPYVYVSIKDNGIGMDESVKARLFEPFFTTKNVGEGTGLGMSIAFTIIEQHQGILTINSEPGAGSEFLLRLPIEPGEKQKPIVSTSEITDNQ